MWYTFSEFVIFKNLSSLLQQWFDWGTWVSMGYFQILTASIESVYGFNQSYLKKPWQWEVPHQLLGHSTTLWKCKCSLWSIKDKKNPKESDSIKDSHGIKDQMQQHIGTYNFERDNFATKHLARETLPVNWKKGFPSSKMNDTTVFEDQWVNIVCKSLTICEAKTRENSLFIAKGKAVCALMPYCAWNLLNKQIHFSCKMTEIKNLNLWNRILF